MLEDQVLSILAERLSSLIARSLLRRSLAALDITPAELSLQHTPALARELEKGIRLFVLSEHQHELLDRIRALGGPSDPKQLTLPIQSETDIARARAAARDIATELGASTFTTQKIVTAVSELARNIVLYAGSGRLELSSSQSPQPKLRILAADRGPGIRDLERLFSGRYKSKTGLGRGLLGLRRAADHFQIDTGAQGTVVCAEFAL